MTRAVVLFTRDLDASPLLARFALGWLWSLRPMAKSGAGVAADRVACSG